MLNNFCFHVYAQKSLFIAENYNAFLDIVLITLSCEYTVHRAGSQLTKAGSECQQDVRKRYTAKEQDTGIVLLLGHSILSLWVIPTTWFRRGY